MEYAVTRSDEYLEHYGIKGQKRGIRRYQNEDGSLTAEGKERYGEQRGWEARQMYKKGTITKAEMKQRTKSDGTIGKIDNAMSFGLGRRSREFNQRHEKGMRAASIGLGALAGASRAAILSKANTGKVSVGAILASATISGATSGASHWVGSRINDAVLNRSYNKSSYKGGKH